MRGLVLQELNQVIQAQKTSSQGAEDLAKRLPEEDRQEGVRFYWLTLEHLVLLDRSWQKVLDRSLASLDLWVCWSLRLLLVQWAFSPRLPDYVVLAETLKVLEALGVSKKARGYVNALGRRRKEDVLKFFQENQGFVYLPNWIQKRWVDQWGVDALKEMVQISQTRDTWDLRLLSSWDKKLLEAEGGVCWGDDPLSWSFPLSSRRRILSSSWFQERAFVQNRSSQLYAQLPIASGASLWDVCAAPGGKTLALLSGGAQDLCLRLTDVSEKRLKRLTENLERLGVQVESVEVWDPIEKAFPFEQDWVLVDAPCSSLGVFFKYPELFHRFTPHYFLEKAKKQKQLLQAVAPQVAVGGKLVFSVCSTEPEETQEVWDDFLKRNKGFEIWDHPFWLQGEWKSSAEGLVVRAQGDWDGFSLIIFERKL